MTTGPQAHRELLERFWQAMQANDFVAAGELLHEEYQLDWPQSGERIHGRANFVAINQLYPAAGPWRFTVHRLLVDGDRTATEVGVTDGAITATVVTFSTIKDGRIWRQVEYW